MNNTEATQFQAPNEGATGTSPLITYLILCYKQEDYIQAALQSALDQTYQPMEILVMDDTSPDGTWDVLNRMAAAYHGPHRLRLHRNDVNLGIVRNLEQGFRLAEGTLIVKADGDDISLPGRVSAIADAWKKAACRPLLLSHGTSFIDLADNPCGESRLVPESGPCGVPARSVFWGKPKHYRGNSSAYARELVTAFAPISERGAVDDLLLTLRAILLSKEEPQILHLSGNWTNYRLGSGCTTDYRRKRATVGRTYRLIRDAYRQFARDLENPPASVDPARIPLFRHWTQVAVRHYSGLVELYEGTTLSERWHGFRAIRWRDIFSYRIPLFLRMLVTAP